jgi:hypothetical protein
VSGRIDEVTERIGKVEDNVTSRFGDLDGVVKARLTKVEGIVTERPDTESLGSLGRKSNEESERRIGGQLDEAMATFAELMLGGSPQPQPRCGPVCRLGRRGWADASTATWGDLVSFAWRLRKKVLKRWARNAFFPATRVRLLRLCGFTIGNDVYIADDLIIVEELSDRGNITIGDRVSIAPRVTLVTSSHPNHSRTRSFAPVSQGPIVIEDGAGPEDLERQLHEKWDSVYLGHKFLYYHPAGAMAWIKLLETDALFLHIEGDEKAAVLDKALGDGPVEEMPVRAVLRADRPMTVYWCP